MIRISNIKLNPGYTDADIEKKLRRERIPEHSHWEIRKLSLDARKKDQIHYLCSVDTSFAGERDYLKRNRNRDITEAILNTYCIPAAGSERLQARPVIIGAGPAGLFAARVLAEAGYCPIVLERGAAVEERTADVEQFWKGGRLKPDSNVQFGEGGAGTFSDGKLNTQVKDRDGRIRQVLTWFVEGGADPSILYWNKPHIGTDVLVNVVKNLRERIISLGGDVRFHAKVEGFDIREGHITGVRVNCAGTEEMIPADCVILAIGHSARDTFRVLRDAGVPMHAKAFAVGVRIEHPQEMIQISQYGENYPAGLPVADYKLTAQTEAGRGVYSFCMCPGGKVVNASSEEERIAVNGMSLSARDGRNANSALVVTVHPEDFPGGGTDALDGIAFQRELEHAAWMSGEGKIPSQLLGDFRQRTASSAPGDVLPDICGAYSMGNLREALPAFIGDSIVEAMPEFGRRIRGYDRDDAVLSGVESRTSSPVRIERGDDMESEIRGLYPCGEGAGYAGGITSAAVDGLKVAEAIIRRYKPWI